ncbi:DUF1284 domain-containing protein [Alkalihalobacillus sp. MEB130]|uniref:DUF1284 domain-containing protein n=1 Tax=Alkalihalobacillus sp. MEB130 TaxID=2976704 RepID=UPI0028DDEBF2|nr:DUF1284 domain-containing protein [Alkalihalobacillus sp. MEB130]MDT8861159.1 DUF1284 domain-containing protein [Alkalihalobacillus sp. MEB130]
MYNLRGHHLFCLLGYRGMGYSKEYVQNMTRIHQTLREDPKTPTHIIKGPDQLCNKYPNSGEYHCQHDNIYERDAAILKLMGLEIGQILYWEDIETRIRKNVIPSDIHTICETCSWRTYGVCEEGIEELLAGKGLREVE